MPDSAPILALGAAVAWVSLVTVEFYERIYRGRIDEYAPQLQALGETQFNNLVESLRKGKTVADSYFDDVNSLKNAEQVLMERRRITLYFLGASFVFSLPASYDPTLAIYGLQVMLIAYALILGVFFFGFSFLSKMIWFDEQIPKAKEVLKAKKKPRGIRVNRGH